MASLVRDNNRQIRPLRCFGVIRVNSNNSTPVPVIDGQTGATIIQKSDGSFWATGYNNYGQFGNGTTTGSTTFIQLPW
jgi:alpha-tubulin suppressor-like RCC1 family protein